MATADLGVRILLEDGASAGFGNISLGLLNIGSGVRGLMAGWSNLDPATKAMGITAGVTGLAFFGLANFLKSSIEAAADFQSAELQVTQSVDGMSGRVGDLSQLIVDLGGKTVYSSQQIAEAFVQLGVHGFDATDILNGLGTEAINLAEAMGQSEATGAATLLSSTIKTFGGNASDASHYANDLLFVFRHGVNDIGALQAAVQQAGATMGSMKVNINDFSAALAFLGEAGLTGSQAGSSLNYMLRQLADPLSKAQKDFTALGLITINQTSPAILKLRDGLESAGSAGQKAANAWDGTLTTLSNMYTAAQKLGTIHTDQTFYSWAVATGAINDKFYDAKGNFIGLSNALALLTQSMMGMNPEQKMAMLGDMFNVRSSKGLMQFMDQGPQAIAMLQQFQQQMTQTSADQAALQYYNTLNGALQGLKTRWTDFKVALGSADLKPVTDLFHNLNDIIGKFIHTNKDGTLTLSKSAKAIMDIGLPLTGAAFGFSSLGFAAGALKGPLGEVGKIFGGTFEQLSKGAGHLNVFKDVDVAGKINGILPPFARLQDTLSRNAPPLEHIRNVFSGLGMDISGKFANAFPHALSEMRTVADSVGGDMPKWQKLGAFFVNTPKDMSVWGNHLIALPLQEFGNRMKSNVMGGLEKLAGMNWGTVQSGIMGLGNKMLGAIPGALGLAASLGPFIIVAMLIAGAVAIVVLLFTKFHTQGMQIVNMFKSAFGPIIASVMKEVKTQFQSIGDEWNKVQPQISKAMDQLVKGFQAAMPVFQLIGKVIGAVIELIIAAIGGLVKGFIDALPHIIGVFTAILNIIGNVGKLIKSIFTGDWAGAVDAVKGIFGGLKDAIGNIFAGIWAIIRDTIGNILGKIGELVDKMKNVPLVGGILNGGKNILSHIPGLAAGGVVTGPTLAMIGEGREPEVVLPVSKLAAFMDNYKSAGTGVGGTTVVNNVIDGQVVGQLAVDHMTGQVRQMGAARMFR